MHIKLDTSVAVGGSPTKGDKITIYILTIDKTIYKKEISNPKDRFELKAQVARLDKKYHDWDMDLYTLKKRTKK